MYVDTESVVCDVIKIRLKRKDERRSGKKKPLNKRWISTYFYDVTHDTFRFFSKVLLSILKNIL